MHNPDAWAALAAWVGVVIASAAAYFAWLQARRAGKALRLARDQAEAAKDQAASSRVSSEASSKSAMAAVDQAASARAMLDVARAERNRADQPQFDISLDTPRNGECKVIVRMLDGPPGIHVTFTWISEYSWPVAPGVAETGIDLGHGQGKYDMYKNEEIAFRAAVDPKSEKVAVRVIAESSDMADSERTWTYVEVVKWARLRSRIL